MKWFKLFDCLELATMGRYSTYNKARSAQARLGKDTDGECDTIIETKETEDICKVKDLDKDLW